MFHVASLGALVGSPVALALSVPRKAMATRPSEPAARAPKLVEATPGGSTAQGPSHVWPLSLLRASCSWYLASCQSRYMVPSGVKATSGSRLVGFGLLGPLTIVQVSPESADSTRNGCGQPGPVRAKTTVPSGA